MIDQEGNKYIIIHFDDPTYTDEYGECADSDWSLVPDNDFMWTYWLSQNDYEIYRPHEIKEKFFHKNTKLSEKKLEDYGYKKIESITYDEAITWFLDFLNIQPLTEYLMSLEKKEKEESFWDFVRQSDMKEEIYVIEDWMRLHFAIQWCEKNHIAYQVKVPEGYPKTLTETTIKKSILEKIGCTEFKSPFSFMNGSI